MGHLAAQIPHPIQIFSSISMDSFPALIALTGQTFKFISCEIFLNEGQNIFSFDKY